MGEASRRKGWRRLACGVLLVSINSVVLAERFRRWRPDAFPDPRKDTISCGREGVKSSICDPENILALESANMVDGLINEIAEGKAPFKKAQCDDVGMQGFAVAVALMHRLDASSQPDKAAATRAFAKSLHANWGVGNPACHNGVLLLLAVADRQAYISSGAGVQEIVSEAQMATVLESIKPALQRKRYADAVLQAVQQLGLLLAGQEPDASGVDAEDGIGIFAFFCVSVAAVMGWSWFANKRQKARFQKCADRLTAIKRDQAAIRARRYAASSCPICLEDFDGADVAPPSRPGDAAAPTSSSAAAAAAGSSTSSGPSTSAAAKLAAKQDEEDAGPSAPLLKRETPAGTSGSSSSSSNKNQKHKPLVLRCGHTFCDPCISEWLKSHTNCPICRKELDEQDDPPASRPTPGPASCNAGAAIPPGMAPEDLLRQQLGMQELGFRLRRLRLLYPDYITDPMLYAWEEDLSAGRALDNSVVQQFEARNPARQHQLEEAGRFGASSSVNWGGGSGSGGGGAGTSW